MQFLRGLELFFTYQPHEGLRLCPQCKGPERSDVEVKLTITQNVHIRASRRQTQSALSALDGDWPGVDWRKRESPSH